MQVQPGVKSGPTGRDRRVARGPSHKQIPGPDVLVSPHPMSLPPRLLSSASHSVLHLESNSCKDVQVLGYASRIFGLFSPGSSSEVVATGQEMGPLCLAMTMNGDLFLFLSFTRSHMLSCFHPVFFEPCVLLYDLQPHKRESTPSKEPIYLQSTHSGSRQLWE